MAGIKKEPGPIARRVAENIRYFRHSRRTGPLTTAVLAERLSLLGQPIPETSITKTEKGTRRVDVDDLVPLALALGVTPNSLLLPQVNYLGATETHDLTPTVSGRAERLWQWAQGEDPLNLRISGSDSWLGGDTRYPDIDFSIRTRPYLTALHMPEVRSARDPGGETPGMRKIAAAVVEAMAAGATATAVRRVLETAIALPKILNEAETATMARDGIVPARGGR